MADPYPASIDQFLNMDLLSDANPAATTPGHSLPLLPVAVQGEDETAGMSFAEMFRCVPASSTAREGGVLLLPCRSPGRGWWHTGTLTARSDLARTAEGTGWCPIARTGAREGEIGRGTAQMVAILGRRADIVLSTATT